MIAVALTDDHTLLRNGLASMLEEAGYNICFQANDGASCLQQLSSGIKPDVILMDIHMRGMNGFEATQRITELYPDIKIIALSMYDDENAVIRMLKAGAKGYVLKDAEPAQLRTAIQDVINKGFFHSDLVTGKLMHAVANAQKSGLSFNLTKKENEFLSLCCSELTYKEIADRMNVSPRTVDGYRDALFEKLEIKTRVGLVMFAIRNGIFRMPG